MRWSPFHSNQIVHVDKLREQFKRKDWLSFRRLMISERTLPGPNFITINSSAVSSTWAFLDSKYECWALSRGYLNFAGELKGKLDPRGMVNDRIRYILDLAILDKPNQ